MGSSPRFSTYLFDLDGTLIDSIDLVLQSWRHTLRQHLGRELPDTVLLEGLGIPLRPQVARFAPDPSSVDAMVATYREFNHTNHDRLVRPYPGVDGMLAALKSQGAALGVVTSKGRWISARGLTACDLTRYFDVLITADDVEEHKPMPQPVLEAIRRLKADLRTTVFVGDSPHDMAAGRAAGVATGAALWGPFSWAALERHEPSYRLRQPADVLSLAGPEVRETGG